MFEFVQSNNVRSNELSDDDIESISKLLSKLPLNHPFLGREELLSTKATLDLAFAKNLVEKYKKLLSQKNNSDSLENRWQEFFSEYLLFFNFGYAERFEKERLSGDAAQNIPDFILLNSLILD